MTPVEKYIKPEVINQIKRLDLRAQFVVKGFLQGLHASPFHGFSVEFSEHRRYSSGDAPKDIDWLVCAKTDKYYLKKFEAETNVTGYLCMDLSRSMNWSGRQAMAAAGLLGRPQEALLRAAGPEGGDKGQDERLTKFDYAICLAAAL